jgi:hypothetical protein
VSPILNAQIATVVIWSTGAYNDTEHCMDEKTEIYSDDVVASNGIVHLAANQVKEQSGDIMW